jgi:hypothetical protein
MLDGFYAKTYADELPNKDMFVSFMVSQNDITARLRRMGIESMSGTKRGMLIDSLSNALTDSISNIDPTLRVNIDEYYEGNRYYMTVYRDFKDLRLVFAPTKSMGKFGGDTDNWMWPRQTCDFSVFRIYADPKTNGPAEYNKKNVPYHPAHYAHVSLDGYKDGDYAMTIGYPGSTDRYLSSYGIQERRDAMNTTIVQTRTIKQDIMKKYMDKDEAVRIKYDSKYAESANYWKNSIGMNRCIDSLGIVGQKQAFERRIKAYIDSTGFLKDSLSFAALSHLYAERFKFVRSHVFFRETFRRGSEMSYQAYKLNKEAETEDNSKIEIKDGGEYYEPLDKEMFASLLDNYAKQVGKEYMPDIYNTIKDKFDGDYSKYADYLYKNSIIMKFGKRISINSRKFKKDCGIQFGRSLIDYEKMQHEKMEKINDSINTQEKYLCAAVLRMEQDMPHYSDANSTMRLSYGTVGGYTINSTKTGYYTTPASILAKIKSANGNKASDYFAEPVLESMLESDNFGQYRDKNTKEMQLCFLTNNDITGGNSGSPVFNGKGDLMGLAFDGNWESLSSDIYFDKKLSRCICVDIRFVLYIMDKWGHADRLIKEIGAK